MGFEKSEPRNNQILLWGVISVITLVALVPLFHSYFGETFGEELAVKVYEQPNTEYEGIRDTQRGHLREAPIDIDRAMDQLATRGRAGTPVVPRPNDTPDLSEEDYEPSLAPVIGWSQRSNERRAEGIRRAMRARRVPAEEPIEDPDATSLEGVEREGADAPSGEVEEGAEPVPAEQPVRPPSEAVPPSAMVAPAAP